MYRAYFEIYLPQEIKNGHGTVLDRKNVCSQRWTKWQCWPGFQRRTLSVFKSDQFQIAPAAWPPRNIWYITHSTNEELGFSSRSALRWKMIILTIRTTSYISIFGMLDNVTFWAHWEWKGLSIQFSVISMNLGTSVIDEVFSYTLSKLNCYFHSENSAFSSPKDTLTATILDESVGTPALFRWKSPLFDFPLPPPPLNVVSVGWKCTFSEQHWPGGRGTSLCANATLQSVEKRAISEHVSYFKAVPRTFVQDRSY